MNSKKRRKRRKVAWALCAASLLLSTSFASAGVSLRFRLTGDPTTLDWNLAQSSAETYIIMNIMEGLTEEGADLKPHPALAERWEITPDGRTYTFFLRTGAKWSDGRVLRASDFVDSWIRLLKPKTSSSYASYLFDVENAKAFHSGKVKDAALVGIRALSDSKLQIKLERRVPYFLHIPSFWVTFPIRADLIAKNGADWALPGKIATLGPYLLTDWKKGRSILLKSNPSYRTAPLVPEVEAIIEPDDQKARRIFDEGGFDFLLNATTEDLMKVGASKISTARVERFPYLATYYLGFNTRKASLGSAEVRHALATAVDRDALPSILQGGQQAAPSYVPPGLDGYVPHAYQPLSLYDARGILARLGHVDGNGFDKLTLWVEKLDGAQALAAYLSKSFHEKLGLTVETHIGSPAEFQKALESGAEDLFVRHWGADYPEPSNFLDVYVSGSGTNYTGWSSAAYDRLIEKARATPELRERMDAYAEAERLLVQKEMAVLPLFYRRNTVLLGPRIKEFSISPMNYLFLKDVSLK